MSAWDVAGVIVMTLNAEASVRVRDGRWHVRPLNLIAALMLATNFAWGWSYGR